MKLLENFQMREVPPVSFLNYGNTRSLQLADDFRLFSMSKTWKSLIFQTPRAPRGLHIAMTETEKKCVFYL